MEDIESAASKHGNNEINQLIGSCYLKSELLFAVAHSQ